MKTIVIQKLTVYEGLQGGRSFGFAAAVTLAGVASGLDWLSARWWWLVRSAVLRCASAAQLCLVCEPA